MYNLIWKAKQRVRKAHGERGLSLLEYCAGAAIIVTVFYVAFFALGESLETLIQAVADWASDRASEIGGVGGPGGGGTGSP